MVDWLELRRVHLQEQIAVLQKNLETYQRDDISSWDNYNEEHVAQVISGTQNLIADYQKQLEIIKKD